jgi:hypothetical protein
MNASLLCPGGLASCSIYLRAEQTNDLFEFQDVGHLRSVAINTSDKREPKTVLKSAASLSGSKTF